MWDRILSAWWNELTQEKEWQKLTKNNRDETKEIAAASFLAPVVMNETDCIKDIYKQQVSNGMMAKRGKKIVPSVECSDTEPFPIKIPTVQFELGKLAECCFQTKCWVEVMEVWSVHKHVEIYTEFTVYFLTV